MNRLRWYILGLWVLAVVVLVAFNWRLAWEQTDVNLLFATASLRARLWLAVAAVVVPGLFQWWQHLEVRRLERRGEQRIQAVKAEAYDRQSPASERLADLVARRVAERLRGEAGGAADSGAAAAQPTARALASAVESTTPWPQGAPEGAPAGESTAAGGASGAPATAPGGSPDESRPDEAPRHGASEGAARGEEP